jgi:hypothetical protein
MDNIKIEKCKEEILNLTKLAKEYRKTKDTNSYEYGLLLGKIEGIEYVLTLIEYFVKEE